MTYFPLQPRYFIYTDSLGDPLNNGYIYLGDANLDPMLYPAKASWDQAGLYPITFPVRTRNGYPIRNGNIAQIFLALEDNFEYSALIQDEDEATIFSSATGLSGYFPASDGGDADTLGGELPSYYTNADNISSGTLADARLSANIAKLDATQTFTGTNTFDETINIANTTTTNLGISITRNSTNVASLIGSFDGLYLNGSQIISFSTGGVACGQFTAVGDFRAYNQLIIGANTSGDTLINLYDLANTTYRTLRWNNSASDWYVEDSGGVDRVLYHAGNDSALMHLAGDETVTGTKTFTSTSGIKIDSSTAASLILDCAAYSNTSRIFFGVADTNVGSISYNPDPTPSADRLSFNVGGTTAEALAVTGAGHIFVSNAIYLGLSSGGDSIIQLYDLANTTYRQLYWNNSASDWYVEDSGGVNRALYHSGIFDFEESTFTPVIVGTSTAGTGTYSYQVGYYQRVGNWVTFRANISWSAHTGTGDILVDGLPYTAHGTRYPPVTIVAANLTYAGELVGIVEQADTYITVFSQATGAALANVAMDTAAVLYLSGCYQVA